MSTVLFLGVIAGLILLSGIFSGTETAIFSLNKIERRRLAEKHPVLGKAVLDHLANPRRTLISILLGNLLINTLATAMVTHYALAVWGGRGTGVAIAVFTVFLVLFGEVAPKTLAVRKNAAFAVLVAVPLRVFSVVIFPLRRLMRFVTDWLVALMIPERKDHPDQISEEELKALVKIGEEEGVLDRDERHMLQKLFELGERSARDIMTHRTDLAALDLQHSSGQHLELIKKYHFSHFPVFQDNIDNIQGVVSVEEFMLSEDRDLRKHLIEPLYVPETKRIDDLLTELRKKNKRFAVCVDEFGGTAGIVTLEDILEEIFGEFYDEYSKVENPIRAYGHQEHLVEAKITLSHFNEYFGTRLEAKDASTLGGWIMERLGEVPEKGKTIKIRGCEIQIHDVIRQRRIRNVLVRKLS